MRVAYITGSLFFVATGNFNEAFTYLDQTHALILSMRGMPLIDISGLQVMLALHEKLKHRGCALMLAGLHDDIQRMMERGGVVAAIGPENIFWSADQAIVAAERRTCAYCANERPWLE